MPKETAEEKLLKIMQKSGAPAPSTPAAPRTRKKSFAFSIRTLNQILLVGIIICAAGLAYEMQSGMSLLQKNVDLSGDVKTPTAIAELALPVSKASAYYLEKISTRNIFRPYEAQMGKSPTAQNLAKRLAKFKLVGVAWLDLPETASIMVENTEDHSTYFIKQGEQLEGVTVKTIYTDRAVFSYENEETTIKL